MKRITKTALLLLSLSGVWAHKAHSQCTLPIQALWGTLTGVNMGEVTYMNETTAYAGGVGGVVGKGIFTNGGWNFTSITLPQNARVRTVFAQKNSQTIFVGNDNGVVYKSTDEGATFNTLVTFSGAATNINYNGESALSTPRRVEHLNFAPAPMQNFGIACTAEGLYVTTNGGANWDLQVTFINSTVVGAGISKGNWYSSTIKNGMAYVSTDYDGGEFFYTSITGASTLTWTGLPVYTAGNYRTTTPNSDVSQRKGRDIAVTDNGTIWIATRSNVLKANSVNDILVVTTVPGNTPEIRGISFYNNQSGVYVNGQRQVYYTQNGGIDWNLIGTYAAAGSPTRIYFSPMGNTFAIAADAFDSKPGVAINGSFPQVKLQTGATIEGSTLSTCANTQQVFTLIGLNASAATHQFLFNNNSVQISSLAGYTATLTVNGTYRVATTLTGYCPNVTLFTTGGINVEITPNVSLAPTISGPNVALCEGTSQNLNVSGALAGNLTISWFKDGVAAGTGSTIQATTVAGIHLYRAVVTTDLACATTPTVTSPGFTLTLNSKTTPAVTINASSLSSCDNISFTATGSNLGDSPSFSWYKNGTAILGAGNTNVLNNQNLNDKDAINVVATSNAACITGAIITSTGIEFVCTTLSTIVRTVPNQVIYYQNFDREPILEDLPSEFNVQVLSGDATARFVINAPGGDGYTFPLVNIAASGVDCIRFNPEGSGVGSMILTISTTGYQNIRILWAARPSNSWDTSLQKHELSVSNNGSTYTAVPYTEAPSLSNIYTLVNGGTTTNRSGGSFIDLPSLANDQATLQIRWVTTYTGAGSGSYRMDDIVVIGDKVETILGTNLSAAHSTEPALYAAVYPNPATDEVNLVLKSGETWAITAATGTVLKSGICISDTILSENIATLPSGIYVISIVSMQGSLRRHKLIKQ